MKGLEFVFLVLGVTQADFTKKVKTASYEGSNIYIDRYMVRAFFLHFPDAMLKLKYQDFVFHSEEQLQKWEEQNRIEIFSMPRREVHPFPGWKDPDGSFGLG